MMLSSLNSIHNIEIEERKEFQFDLELHQERKHLLEIGLYFPQTNAFRGIILHLSLYKAAVYT